MKTPLALLSLIVFCFALITLNHTSFKHSDPSGKGKMKLYNKENAPNQLPDKNGKIFAAPDFSNLDLVLPDYTAMRKLPGSKVEYLAAAEDLPEISFDVDYLSVAEDSAAVATCRSFKDYVVKLSISKQPMGNVTVVLKTDSSSATRTADYEISGGDFISRTDTVIFTKEGSLTKDITIRIYDDVEYEVKENFRLQYSILANSPAKPGTNNQEVLVEISDNDTPPTLTTVKDNDSVPFIFRGRLFVQDFSKTKLQILYKASELNAAGIYKGSINSIAFKVLQLNSQWDYTNLSISVGTNTSDFLKAADTLSKSDNLSNYYYSSHYFTGPGWNTFRFSHSFTWDGVSNIVVQICYDYDNNSLGAQPDWVASYPDGSIKQSNFVFGVEQTCLGTIDLASSFALAYKPKVRMGASNIVAPLISPTIGSNQYAGSFFQQDENYLKFQILYSAADLAAAGISKGYINNVSFNVLSKNTTNDFRNFKISIGTTNAAFLVDGGTVNQSNNLALLYSASYVTTHPGWNTFSGPPVFWDDASNIVIEMCYQNDIAGSPTEIDRVASYYEGNTGQSNFLMGRGKKCTDPLSASDASFIKPQIKIGVKNSYSESIVGTTIANDKINSDEQYLASQNDLYYRKGKTTEVISRIQNRSSHNYGCTEVSIDTITKSDTAAKIIMPTIPICVNNQTVKALGKTYHVDPAKNNANGEYDITFYFTKEEITSWELATGLPWDSVLVVKAPMPISYYAKNNCLSSAGARSVGQNRASRALPQHEDVGGYSSLTASFPTGFSYFFFIPPTKATALPITLQSFSGLLKDDHSLLEWTTASEMNTKSFKIERSFDGEKYDEIGEVTAAGMSNQRKDYTFTDKQVALEKNYYRLKQVDLDGRFTFSNVVLIRNDKKQNNIVVATNPFDNYIQIRFASPPKGIVRLALTDLSGRKIESAAYNGVFQSSIRHNLTNKLISKGAYLLVVEMEGSRYTLKVMKQ